MQLQCDTQGRNDIGAESERDAAVKPSPAHRTETRLLIGYLWLHVAVSDGDLSGRSVEEVLIGRNLSGLHLTRVTHLSRDTRSNITHTHTHTLNTHTYTYTTQELVSGHFTLTCYDEIFGQVIGELLTCHISDWAEQNHGPLESSCRDERRDRQSK